MFRVGWALVESREGLTEYVRVYSTYDNALRAAKKEMAPYEDEDGDGFHEASDDRWKFGDCDEAAFEIREALTDESAEDKNGKRTALCGFILAAKEECPRRQKD